MKRTPLVLLCAAGGLLQLAAAPTALGFDAVLVVVANNTGQPASDLHLTFSGGGGVLYADPVAIFAGGCPTPAVPSNPPVVTNTVVVDWGVACVTPATYATVLVTTPNGPLTYVSGFWTRNNVNIGAISSADISVQRVSLPPPPIGGPVGMKIQVRYRPCGPGVYTPWMKGPNTCWIRTCCFPAGFVCEFRIILCPFTNPFNRFWETGPWAALTPWRKAGKTGPIWFRQRLTYPPPPDRPIIVGPLCNMPALPLESERPWYATLEVKYSDDGGVSYRPATDFNSTFLAVGNALAFDVQTLPGPTTFEELLLYYSPKYEKAAALFQPLIGEAQLVFDSPLDPDQAALMLNVIGDLEALSAALAAISADFADAEVRDASAFQAARDALTMLAVDMQGALPARFAHTADNLDSMAFGFDVAAQMVEAGLDVTTNQDFFLWGLQNRFQPMLAQAASSTLSHARIYVNMGDYQWFRSAGPGVDFKVQQVRNGQIVDSGVAPISDLDAFDVQFYAYGVRYRVWFKPPTHLSRVVTFTAAEGVTVSAGTLIGGDVNGDNCIDARDVDQVIADLGTGGPLAAAVTSSDANYDGVVDDIDLDIVLTNLGQCGQLLPLILPHHEPLPHTP